MSRRVRYLLIILKVGFLIASIYSFFSAYSTLKEYVHHVPHIKIAEDGIRDVERSRGLGDVYKRQ